MKREEILAEFEKFASEQAKQYLPTLKGGTAASLLKSFEALDLKQYELQTVDEANRYIELYSNEYPGLGNELREIAQRHMKIFLLGGMG